jgi:protein MPE1
MASASVYYRFKSQKEPSRITFDGTGISVWDLKREIILQNKMGKGLDFDLAVYSQDTEDGEEVELIEAHLNGL